MKPDEFEFIAREIKKRSGLALTPDKAYLLESRLLPIARNCGCQTLSEFINMMRLRAAEDLFIEVTEAMTTNESMFFRDTKPFDQLKKVILPRVLEGLESRKTLRIWSGACSNGQEAYSILITLMEERAKMAGIQTDIIGTDISNKVLDKAKKGIYSQFEVQRGMPITMLVKYFAQLPDNQWQVNEALRSQVSFRFFNLLDDVTMLGKFDIVFCRNVLIYFDEKTKGEVLDKIARTMNPKGVLLLGSAETIIGLTDKFVPMKDERGLYVLSN